MQGRLQLLHSWHTAVNEGVRASAAKGTGMGRWSIARRRGRSRLGGQSCGRRVNTGSWRVPARLVAEQAPRLSTARHR